MIKTIKIIGVPEHFNYPWHYALKKNLFEVPVVWKDEKGGTGAMAQRLENGEADLAIMLTEGAIKYIAEGGNAKILQVYVKSPLIWGVHARKELGHEVDYEQCIFARSRKGSGSHIMGYVFAENQNFLLQEEDFLDVGGIDGAMEAFEEKKADIILWEKFMTQNYVDQGKVIRLEDCVTPWPCFVLVASDEILKKAPEQVSHISETIVQSILQCQKEKNLIADIAHFYHISENDCEKWYLITEWQTTPYISSKMLENVIATIQRVGMLNKKVCPADLCFYPEYLY